NVNNKILQTCKTVLSTLSHLQNCKFYHPGENNTIGCHGKIIRIQCQVNFIKLIPHNLNECPFVILICHGVYNHLLPPSAKIST
ncbi:19128_t:CDS:2, partial [Dentiscutata erythropus]